jgi:AraC family transcriptional regulator
MPPNTSIRIREYPAFHAMAPHMHDETSINIVVGGGFAEQIGRTERHYRRGHIALLPAGIEHAQRFGASVTRQIIFQPQESWLDYLADSKTDLADSPHFNSLAFRHLGDRLIQEMRVPDGFSDIACEGILLEVVAQFGRDRAAVNRRLTPPPWLARARDFLHERAFGPLAIADVAREAGRHEVHVAREFRRFYGLSVGAYLRKLCIESAALRLAESRANICEVALECGFSNHSHLCREFRRHFGVTPAQYRASRAN